MLSADSSSSGSAPSLVCSLARLHSEQGEMLARLTAAIEDEHGRRPESATLDLEQDRGDLIHRLLAAEDVDPSELRSLGYELDAWHLGIIATGAKAERALRDLKGRLGCELLTDVRGGSVRAWLGGPRPVGFAEFKRALSRGKDAGVSFAVGEPRRAIDGWRLSHHQACEARRVALYVPRHVTLYAENRLLAVGLSSETFAMSLKDVFMAPLRGQPDGGVALRRTLRAYIDAECRAKSAASAIGVGRHAVEGRIRTAERLMGQGIRSCLGELDAALRLEELADHPC